MKTTYNWRTMQIELDQDEIIGLESVLIKHGDKLRSLADGFMMAGCVEESEHYAISATRFGIIERKFRDALNEIFNSEAA